MPDRVVVGIDGSEHAGRALDFALEEVRRRGDAVLVAVRAVPLPVIYGVDTAGVPSLRTEFEQQARAELEDALREVPDDVAVETVVVEGAAATVLVELSDDAALVVVGSRGRGGFRSLVLGSTSQQLVSHAHCPVVVVHDPASPATEDPESPSGEGHSSPV